MSQKKKTSQKAISHRTGAEIKAPAAPPTEEQKRTGKKVKKKVPCEINDDLADSYCIALYGYLPKTKQKLKEERF